MHHKYTLGGRMVVEGENAEKMFNIISNRRLPTSNFWIYWNEAEELATITITLKTISAKFEIFKAPRRYVNSVVSRALELKHHDSKDDSREVYQMMIEQCEQAECKEE